MTTQNLLTELLTGMLKEARITITSPLQNRISAALEKVRMEDTPLNKTLRQKMTMGVGLPMPENVKSDKEDDLDSSQGSPKTAV